ncbi:hypothetical protein DPMN_089350 [Dreissena polymorpha]|uniref:Uncharacterized protein n=1 Tax=Dreissena polymorpha TaxID=45954 RepID=A0A9D4KWP3_DREPO|nr:hypothetical protein DPMN_089350 [Dreissena polymorpha]
MKSVYDEDIGKTTDEEMIEEFPSDLKLLDAQSAEVFAKALKDGFEVVKNIRLMVLGMFGVGKTSLINNLIKDLRDEYLEPMKTGGFYLHRCKVMDDGEWCLDRDLKKVRYKCSYRDACKHAIKVSITDLARQTDPETDFEAQSDH